MDKNKILGITIPLQSKQDILEKIIKYLSSPKGFFHIISLNPENLVIAQKNQKFKKIVETAQIKIIDGAGIVMAGRLLNLSLKRLTGVDLMKDLINLASSMRLRVLLIGGQPNLALELSDCYNEQFPKAKFKGLYGLRNVKNPVFDEEVRIFSIVRSFKPQLTFVAFGSPDQELWIERHRKELSGSVVMGVGGAFNYLSNSVRRAPLFMQKLGLEWLFRLINQPWRSKRQLRLLKFIYLVFKEKWIKN
ncbi:MAG: Glycosyl transferase, WecB/TagA/CpsF family [Candidatus Roizmanbacteria bacterium GW2011_GWC2_37_13]|uniref:Glycosyl transferase, WecB/TagA/CpsF family n=1 Tax=Candidatus Roizmanbacteria bacterium GW2011_GWC2_37_13 TaxID=1618486 RepID=A0A0G0JCY8_9BACT|nr:MAG: glycosyl transferase, WecB/TagA/CpsF family, N-acetylglucosaminyldiphosphoundecaprenol [Candidatus Roizmanbacteria bacterium GW2011_GWC1_37_12]KKQ26036.1 MAG: Glycosyl transferase, WecB/TagA/CpsF family [Candidatus Roizmanbacteria bacterium GW2011_GWC2_37_13]